MATKSGYSSICIRKSINHSSDLKLYRGRLHHQRSNMKLLLVLLCALVGSFATKVRYDGFQVHQITPDLETQVIALQELELTNFDYNFWTPASTVGRAAYIMVPPQLRGSFADFLEGQSLQSKVVIENVQERIDNERPKQRQSRAFGWDDYHTLEEIDAWLYEVEALYPNQVTVINGGDSYEGRQILGVHISFSPDNFNNAVFIESGIHAREWIAPAVATWLINDILTTNVTASRNTYERYDWYIFPVFNPDGYVYSFTTNRMWRKTRTPYSPCVGADPNRNWPYRWNTGGASNNTCSDIYHGPTPLSERCVATTASYISSVSSRLVAYLSFHSFSQLFLIPYSHTATPLDNFQELYDIGVKGAESLAARHGTQFRVGNGVAILYVATGVSVDWVKANFGTRITYTYEFRDTGFYGFILPADQIIPSSEEVTDSVITILDEFNALP